MVESTNMFNFETRMKKRHDIDLNLCQSPIPLAVAAPRMDSSLAEKRTAYSTRANNGEGWSAECVDDGAMRAKLEMDDGDATSKEQRN
mmetsp:Transcript_4756/g.10298  ORF Transcript_4756/g.10298 Transcript_4756/m.10298 type:complete len:88 (+) Transcript_4756:3-266(+)